MTAAAVNLVKSPYIVECAEFTKTTLVTEALSPSEVMTGVMRWKLVTCCEYCVAISISRIPFGRRLLFLMKYAENHTSDAT
jgi:hypothetical protein